MSQILPRFLLLTAMLGLQQTAFADACSDAWETSTAFNSCFLGVYHFKEDKADGEVKNISSDLCKVNVWCETGQAQNAPRKSNSKNWKLNEVPKLGNYNGDVKLSP
ncbi:hypothetical protein [Pseudomonas sp. Marseille-P9899]|uniref:hypothetical protein n=1 Tax=Pseudomonas sp. Marseille-P9899 TaxID=2730401 RepID=UPI00158E54AD|nr:hypothetical protein [Pseudomonas sp. Marseille-P9899]